MLKGKPARTDDRVSEASIKSILAVFENELEAAEHERQPAPAPQADPIGNLAPVAVVEDKVARPKYTTVPNSEQNSAMTRKVDSKMADRDVPMRSHAVASDAPLQAQDAVAVGDEDKPRIALPKLSLPKFSLPRVAMPKVDVPKLSLPKIAVPKVVVPKREVAAHDPNPPETLTPDAPQMQMLRDAEEETRISQANVTMSKIKSLITPRRVALAMPILFALIWPATAMFLVLLAVFVIVGTFVLMGAENVWDAVARFAKRYTAKHPDRKDAVYRKLDNMAVLWDAFLDRFPEGTVDGLYMPDFSNIDEVERQHDAKVTDRLNRMQSQS